MYLARLLVALGLLSGASQDPIQPAKAEVAIVFQHPPTPDTQEMMRELIVTLAEDDRVGSILRIPFTLHSAKLGLSRPQRMVPDRTELVATASRADRIICVGNVALQPFLRGNPTTTPIYSLGAVGLAYLPEDNLLLPNRQRLRGAVPLDITLAEAVRGTGLVLKNPTPMGAIVSDGAPAELIEEGTRIARTENHELYVERIANPRELRAAVNRLRAKGIRSLLFLPDLNAMASPTGLLSRNRLRLMLLREGVAVMGMKSGDSSSHYAFEPDRREAARELGTMVLADLDSDEPPQRGIVLIHSFSTWVNKNLASLYSVELIPSPK